MLRNRRISPNRTTNRFSAASPNGSSPGGVDSRSSPDDLLVGVVVVLVGLEQHDAAGVLVAEEREGVVDRRSRFAEADDVAVGLDRVEDPVGAGERLDQAVLAAGSCPPTTC